MAFKHIRLFVLGTNIQDVRFSARITLAYTKSKKDDASNNVVLTVDSLTNPAENAVDPIKLLLIHALRTGAVASTSYEQLVGMTLRRLDKMVQWVFPDRPVLPQFTRAERLNKDLPANGNQVLDTIQKSARLAGIV